MPKSTTLDDLYERWSDQALVKYSKFERNKKLFPAGIYTQQDIFTSRQVRRFMKGLHKGIYPRGKAWERIED